MEEGRAGEGRVGTVWVRGLSLDRPCCMDMQRGWKVVGTWVAWNVVAALFQARSAGEKAPAPLLPRRRRRSLQKGV